MSFIKKLYNRKKHTFLEVGRRKVDPFFEEEADEENTPEEDAFFSVEEQQESANMIIEKDEEYQVVEREILPTKIVCPDCGGITLEGLDFCDKCGGEI